jgi:hypothetical protein
MKSRKGNEQNLLGKLAHYKKYFLVSLLYLIFTLAMFYPLALHPNSLVLGDRGGVADLYQNLWDIWWVKYALFNLHTNAFSTKILFWPSGLNLAFVTLAPIVGLISAPFQGIGIAFAYNIIYFLGFVLSGLGMFILAQYITDNIYASVVAGFIFTFSAFHIAQSLHIHFINIEFVPLFLYFLLKLMREDKNNLYNAAGMSFSLAFSSLMGNVEQTIMLVLVFLLMIAIYLCYKKTRQRILSRNFALSLVLFAVLTLAIGSWNFIPLLNGILHSGGIGRANSLNTIKYNEAWSVFPADFFVPSYYNGLLHGIESAGGLYPSYSPQYVEQVAYIGITVIVLVAFGLGGNKKRDMIPWVIGALIFAWLSLGPVFGLYEIYHSLPAINIIREPGRFDLITSMFLAILAAYGAKIIFEHIKASNKGYKMKTYLVLMVILLLMFVENNGVPISGATQLVNPSAPQIYYQIANTPGNFSVLELPATPFGVYDTSLYPAKATFYTSITHKPLVGGYAGGRENVSNDQSLAAIPLVDQTYYLLTNNTDSFNSSNSSDYTNQTLMVLSSYNTSYVILQKGAFTQNQLPIMESYLQGVFGNPVYNDNTTIAFETANATSKYLNKN